VNYATHRLAHADLDSLGSGRITSRAVRRLTAAQRSKNTLLLEAIRRAVHSQPELALSEIVQSAVQLLTDIQSIEPSIVQDLIASPHFGFWAAECAISLRSSVPSVTNTRDISHVASFAASAALLAKYDFQIHVPVHNGRVVLPTLGEWRLPAGSEATHADVRLRQNQATLSSEPAELSIEVTQLTSARHDIDSWTPTTRLNASAHGIPIEVLLDSSDPFLSRLHSFASPRPIDIRLPQWQRSFAQAWHVVCGVNRPIGAALRRALTTLFPLPNHPNQENRSASSGWAWGMIALSLPSDSTSFAEALIHEFHHQVLSAIEDITPLICSTPEPQLVYAPWRDDPRPVHNLLQGSYAFFGVCDFWGRQRAARDTALRRRADISFRLRQRQLSDTLPKIQTSGLLTEVGARFASAMLRRISDWQAIPATMSETVVYDMRFEHLLRWRLTNLAPNQDAIRQVARAWLARLPQCPIKVPSNLRPTPDTVRLADRSHLLELTYWSAIDSRTPGVGSTLSLGDAMLLAGDAASALRLYFQEVLHGGQADAWVGLSLALNRLRIVDARALKDIQVLSAVTNQVRDDIRTLSDLTALINWISTAPLVC
jgi:HEXXH motif-containing protein